ncbi:protein INCA1 isoform X2 [Octodon degus]|uniref:Protein INCA1 isoform X2 n=1 Tax=Octodon degus TaxID=10160 RepID=A0A6P6F2Z1_OCTDE|nr:protein INCA1 isoform X2 [Octodon degus]
MQVQENEDNFIPFAKCSRVVSRCLSPGLPSQSLKPIPKYYGDTFWENLTQRSSPIWMEEQYIPPMLPGLYPPEGLPPPEMLCRRKRRRPRLDRMHQGSGGIPAQVKAVAYHLEDLRRRQRTINELKKAQWGTSEDAPEPLEVHEEGCGFLKTSEYPDLTKEESAYPQGEDHFINPGRAQLLWSPWSPLGQEGACTSRQLSSVVYSTVTARRNPVHYPWGIELESEELGKHHPKHP